jgi:hypothetical protein
MGTNSFLALTMPCTVGEGIFVRVNVSSNNNQSDSEVLYVESKSPPYPGDPICPEEIIGGPFGDAKFKDLIEVSPNPFTIETTIKYMLEKEEYTKISVFDSNGNLVDLLVDAVQPKGAYSIKFNRKSLSAGVYFIQIQSHSTTLVTKLIIL